MKTTGSFHGSSISDFCKALKKTQKILLACHVLPEGDALGSLFAMASLLNRLGKKTYLVGQENPPATLQTLFSCESWYTSEKFKSAGHKFDAVLVTDCAKFDRIGTVAHLISPKTPIFNIDHHISNEGFGTFNLVHPQAAATGEVVYDIFKHLKLSLTKDEARYLYIAISTDTGSFRYSNTCARTHRIAAELIGTGIDVETISRDIYSNYSLNKIFLYSYLLKKIRTSAKDQIAWASMTRQDVKRYGADYEDSEGFVDFLRLIQSVKVVFFASEVPGQDAVRVSFRSKGEYDVQKIAAYFDGGGHKKSSGCLFYKTTLKKVIEQVLERIHAEFHL